VVDAFDTAFYSTTGTALLELPAPSLLFTPYRNGKPLPTISCAAVAGGAGGSVSAGEVTVTDAPILTATSTSTPSSTPTPSSTASPATPAPTYECASTYRTPTYRTPLPMTVTASGVLSVGHLLTVTLSSPDTGLADPAPGLATKLKFTGRLPVTGAQASQVRLKETTANAEGPTFTVSGRLRLAKAGTDTISFPRQFVYTVYLQNTNARKAIFSCTLATSAASPAPVALTVQVAR
jgi:hypothetical protein